MGAFLVLLTVTSLPLAAEAGLVVSALGDRERVRSSSASSSGSLDSSKFILPDRPGEGERCVRALQFHTRQKTEKIIPEAMCMFPATKESQSLHFISSQWCLVLEQKCPKGGFHSFLVFFDTWWLISQELMQHLSNGWSKNYALYIWNHRGGVFQLFNSKKKEVDKALWI